MQFLRTFVLLLLVALPVFAQQPDVDAALNALFANDLKTALRYAPPEIQAGVAKLTQEQRDELDSYLPLTETLKKWGATLIHPSEGESFLIFDDPGGGFFSHLDFLLVHRECGNDRSALTFHEREDSNSETVTVRMRYIYPDWRVVGTEGSSSSKPTDFEDEKWVPELMAGLMSGNESDAKERLFEYLRQIAAFTAQNPDLGVPRSLEELGAAMALASLDDDRELRRLKDLTTPPFEHSRYRFHYTRKSRSRFTLTARPMVFNASGRRSYYTDESGKILFTDKDEPPTQQSEPLE